MLTPLAQRRSQRGFERNQYHEFSASRLRVDNNGSLQLLQESSQKPHAEAFGLGRLMRAVRLSRVLPLGQQNALQD